MVPYGEVSGRLVIRQMQLGVAVDQLDGAVWRKSNRSGTQGECVEVSLNLPDIVAVRDSKDPNGPKLIFAPRKWASFVTAVREDSFQIGASR